MGDYVIFDTLMTNNDKLHLQSGLNGRFSMEKRVKLRGKSFHF